MLLLPGIPAASQPTPSASPIEPLTLRATKLPFTPNEFYITDVVDERENPTAIAYLLPADYRSGQRVITQVVDVQGGARNALRAFIRQSLPRNSNLRPVIARLQECQITETPGDNGQVNGQVILTVAFDLLRDNERVELVAYRRGGASYSRPAGAYTVVEQALRQSVVGALRYLNTWMNREAGRSEKLASGIHVSFTDYSQNTEPDTVFYAADRPLVWDDFRDTPNPRSHYAASVFPSFAYEGDSKIVDGILRIHLTLKVYVLKQSSWVRESAKDAYGLNHEQRHFDIARLLAERFKQKVPPDSLTIEDFNSIIQWKYIDSFREMNRLQEQYDDETRHGLDHAAQERWNQRIDAELRELAVKQ